VTIEPHRPALPATGRGEDAIAWEQLATHVLRRHGITLAAAAMIVIQLVWKAAVLSHFYFWQDDFVYFDRALEHGLTWQYLTTLQAGHLDPGPFTLSWALSRISLYNWTLVSVVLLLILVASSVALLRLLRTLFGNRPAILIPLAIYLASPLTVPDLVWWSNGIEGVSLALATFMALDAHVRYVRAKRPRHMIVAAVWLLVGMLFFEKGIVLAFLLFALTSAFLVEGRWIRAVLRTAARYWKAWLLYAVVTAGYALVFALLLTAPGAVPGKRTAPQDVPGFMADLVKDTFVPGAFGGPWRWFPNKVEAFAAPPTPLIWLSFLAAIVVIAASIWHRKYAWRAWAILAAWLVVADMVPIIIGRLNLANRTFLPFLALDTHYVADAVPVVAICLGLAFWPVVGQPDLARRPSQHAQHAQLGQAAPVAIGIALSAFIFGSIWSVQSYVSVTTTQPGRAFIENARLALAEVPRGTPVADQLASSNLMSALLLGRYGYEDEVLGKMAPGKIRWIRQPDGTIANLKVFAPDGSLWPAAVVGVYSKPIPGNRGCWAAKGENISVPLRSVATVTNGPQTLRISYVSSLAQRVYVEFGGRSQQLALKKGLNTGYLPVLGSGSSVLVMTPGNNGKLCIGSVAVGVILQNLSGSPLPPIPFAG
jgi:hypothetical protein